MADRFPSLEEFDEGKTEATGTAGIDGIDEPSDFLARERAVLGDDAEQFTSSADNTAATVADGDDDDDDDLLGGGGGGTNSYSAANDDMMGHFETSFPTVSSSTQNEYVAPGGATEEYEVEPDVVREWRERRDQQIQHRDEVSAGKKAETVKVAQEAVDDFYEQYNNRKDKQIAQTRKEAEEFLKSREDTTAGGTSWERIAKLVDLSGKGTTGGAAGSGKAKMRELLVSLRKDEKAPGAIGV